VLEVLARNPDARAGALTWFWQGRRSCWWCLSRRQRNFRIADTDSPFAGNPNGVVVYPPYLTGQYCGMLSRI